VEGNEETIFLRLNNRSRGSFCL